MAKIKVAVFFLGRGVDVHIGRIFVEILLTKQRHSEYLKLIFFLLWLRFTHLSSTAC